MSEADDDAAKYEHLAVEEELSKRRQPTTSDATGEVWDMVYDAIMAASGATYERAREALTRLRERMGEVETRYKGLVGFYDQHVGTPCEQVRHRQEVEALQADRDRLQQQIIDQGQACYVNVVGMAPDEDDVPDVETAWKVIRHEIDLGHKTRQNEAVLQQRVDKLEEESRQWEKASLVKLLHERDALQQKYQALVKFYDEHQGTPCEQIRHREQVEALEQEIEQLKLDYSLLADDYTRIVERRRIHD